MVARRAVGYGELDRIVPHLTQLQPHRACGAVGSYFTVHEYPLMVWAADEVLHEQVQISSAKLQSGMIGRCTLRVSMQSRSQNLSLTRQWGGNSAL